MAREALLEFIVLGGLVAGGVLILVRGSHLGGWEVIGLALIAVGIVVVGVGGSLPLPAGTTPTSLAATLGGIGLALGLVLPFLTHRRR